MHRATFAHISIPLGIVIVCFGLFLNGVSAETSAQRPFWTEQSSFLQGDELYTVGVASHAPTLEDGRQQAFNHGVAELKNFVQVGTLQGLTITTQMTYEENHSDGTITVFRLLRVPIQEILARQTHRLNSSMAGFGFSNHNTQPLEKMNEQEQAVAHLSQKVTWSVQQRSQLSCRYVKEGMTSSQTESLLGEPDKNTLQGGFGTWSYGTTEIWFIDDQVAYLELGQPCHDRPRK